MKEIKYPWRPQDDLEGIDEGIAFLSTLGCHQIAFSKKALRKIGSDADYLACKIADRATLLHLTSGDVRCNGHWFTYELIRTELTWTEDPTAPYDEFNFTWEVSVCTGKESGQFNPKSARELKRKLQK